MNCREFESGLDFFLREPNRAPLDAEGRDGLETLESHAAECEACRELLDLAQLPLEKPVEEPGDFTLRVLARTSGTACGQAEEKWPDFVDGSLPSGADRQLLAEHLEHCLGCSDLVSELERLALDLPRLAIVQPEASLIDDILRRTLPAPVRLRRWWKEAGPRWVRRPRFASELAFAATLVLIVVFGTPVSPLQAMPEKALEFARTEPFEQFEVLQSSARDEVVPKLRTAIARGSERAQSLAGAASESVGTLLDEVASWFENAEDEPAAETDSTKEETS